MEHLNTILDTLGAEIDHLNSKVAVRDYELRIANEQLEKMRRENADLHADLATQGEERARDQVIMAQTAKLVIKLRDKALSREGIPADNLADCLENILAVLADCAKEEN